ncbi:MAG TPA: FtsQ-type POTRA domain-containing protein [Labilithrix sp.]|nr:FtsQ-type POTRA domain-containing protein [Labilithrix sp.]
MSTLPPDSLPPAPRSRNTRKSVAAKAPGKGPASVAPVALETKLIPAPSGESRAMRIARGVLGFALVIGIGGTVAWGARRYVKTSQRFAVSEIITTGAKHRTPDELATIAGIAKGQNVFTTDLDRARARLVADPWVSEATLARQLPGTIFLRVVEREAGGIVATNDGTAKAAGGETYLVTREGAIIKRLETGDPTDFTIVTGVVLQQLVDDREGATRTIRRALDLGADYERSTLAQRSPLEEVHVELNGEMTLVIGKSAISLHMGAPPYRRKLEQAVRVVAELDRRGAKADAIMLDNEARPDRVVVRMR